MIAATLRIPGATGVFKCVGVYNEKRKEGALGLEGFSFNGLKFIVASLSLEDTCNWVFWVFLKRERERERLSTADTT